MTETYNIKRGDTTPLYEAQLKAGDGSVVDLNLVASARLLIEAFGGSNFEGAMALDAGQQIVSYDWQPGETDVAGGNYKVEIEVTYTSGKIQTFPARGHAFITVTEDIGGDA